MSWAHFFQPLAASKSRFPHLVMSPHTCVPAAFPPSLPVSLPPPRSEPRRASPGLACFQPLAASKSRFLHLVMSPRMCVPRVRLSPFPKGAHRVLEGVTPFLFRAGERAGGGKTASYFTFTKLFCGRTGQCASLSVRSGAGGAAERCAACPRAAASRPQPAARAHPPAECTRPLLLSPA